MKRVGACVLTSVLVLVSGCAEKPVLEVFEAQQALAAARDAEADIYAPEEYELAVSNLENAIAAIERQEEEPLWARSYAFAGDLLALSMEQSEAAQEFADSIRLEASVQAEVLIPEAQTAIDSAFAGLEQARSTSVAGRRQLDTLDADLRTAADLLGGARESLEGADYATAVTQAGQALELAVSVRIRSEEISQYAIELELEQQAIPEETPDPLGP